MNKFNLSELFGVTKEFTIKHSSEILTGIGIAGLISTSILTGKATLKASKILEDERENRKEDISNNKEIVKICWKPYIPAVMTGVASISCIIFASSQNYKRNAALATAYGLSETALREYKDKVVEVIGEKKEKSIKEAIAKDKIESNPVDSKEIIFTGKGETLCYDSISGRYFKSDIEDIKSACNKANSELIKLGYISLNDFYYEIGLEANKLGDLLGWNVSKDDLIDLNFSSQLATDGTPCLVLDYIVMPKYDFNIFG
jgi:hypothetical protein